jgi:hypothetical protein
LICFVESATEQSLENAVGCQR